MFVEHNFDFILTLEDNGSIEEFNKLKHYLILAEYYYSCNQDVSVLYCRRAIEFIVHDIYTSNNWLPSDEVVRESIFHLIRDDRFFSLLHDIKLIDSIITTVYIANGAAHQRYASDNACFTCLYNLFKLTRKFLLIKGYESVPVLNSNLLLSYYPDGHRVNDYIEFLKTRTEVVDASNAKDPFQDEMRMLEKRFIQVERDNKRYVELNKMQAFIIYDLKDKIKKLKRQIKDSNNPTQTL